MEGVQVERCWERITLVEPSCTVTYDARCPPPRGGTSALPCHYDQTLLTPALAHLWTPLQHQWLSFIAAQAS